MNVATPVHPAAKRPAEGLTADQRKRLLDATTRHHVARGDTLIAPGALPDRLFIVLHGKFQVEPAHSAGAACTIGADGIIGAAAFLSGKAAHQTVTALRDSAVLRLERSAFDRIVSDCPDSFLAILRHLMTEFGVPAAPGLNPQASETQRIVAVVQGGGEPAPPVFWTALRHALERAGATVVDARDMRRRFGADAIDRHGLAAMLNGLASEAGPLVCLTDPALTEWTERAIAQADEVVIATRGPAPAGGLSEIERCALELHDSRNVRLVRVHDHRTPTTTGTAAWLARIDAFMSPHVALQDQVDFLSLARFLTPRAIGFVAGGGGGLGAAHVGVFRAFSEAAVEFDIFGGTSVGAAMLAGFCRLEDAERLDLGAHRIFVESKSFKRFSVPKYGLLDHQNFDRALQREYGEDTLIEDCWRPFFAVATNLSTKSPEIIRRGVMWKAVRASSAIPGMLPPMYTDDGMMLVDGGIMDNAPLDAMRALKSGPNVLVHFNTADARRYKVDYDALPGRTQLLAGLINPFHRLPRAPSVTSVLWRSLLVHQKDDLNLGPGDFELRPPRARGASVIDFSKHRQVYLAGYEWTQAQMAARNTAGDGSLASVMAASRIGLEA
ncbi:MAG: patatin-like phospholipase family protein [Oceanicaulis sp.]|nr:patatin-like phospholipase family protein [Oceanicaulis sp.]